VKELGGQQLHGVDNWKTMIAQWMELLVVDDATATKVILILRNGLLERVP
jgi:hypothetical protein